MSKTKHHGCGKCCGLCRPWKKWRGNFRKWELHSNRKPDIQDKDND